MTACAPRTFSAFDSNLKFGIVALILALVTAGMILAAPPLQAQTFTVVHNFTGADGANPYPGLMIDRGGKLYGTTVRGGAGSCNIQGLSGCGTVFRVQPTGHGWFLNTLYSFHGTDGISPYSRVIFGPDGSLYGTTEQGGGVGSGTVFKLRPPASACKTALCSWSETLLYSFTGGQDGGSPYSEVLFDQTGNLYGTTYAGGDHHGGTVYELTPSNGWAETVIYNFGDSQDGEGPYGGMVFDASGNLYATASAGGYTGCNFGSYSGCGTVIQLKPSGSGWTETALYRFQNGSSGNTPEANLIIDGAGNLYGTTLGGGQHGGGTAFVLTPSNGNWEFNVVYPFTTNATDSGPFGPVTMDSAGNLYGTISGGGLYGYGAVFKLTPSNGGWTYTVLYSFTGADDGKNPSGTVVLDPQGNLYGTTLYGGASQFGLVWEIAL